MDPDCEVSRWRDWTPCSVTCGQGIRILSRVYKYHGVDHSKCNLVNSIIEPCQGILPTCEEERTKGISRLKCWDWDWTPNNINFFYFNIYDR